MTNLPPVVSAPGAHLGLTWRPVDPGDIPELVDLARRSDAQDAALHPFTRRAIERLLFAPSVDPVADTLVGRDNAGTVRAAAFVQHERGRRRATLWATLDPAWRGRGLGRAMLRWQDARAREVLAGTGPGGRVQLFVDDHAADRRRLATAAGLSPERTYLQLERDLRLPLDEPRVPDGVRIAGWDARRSEQAREVHLAAFGPDSSAADPAGWEELCAGAQREWSFLALAGADVIGHVLSLRDETIAQAAFATTSHIAVRPQARRQGTARALLVTALGAYAAADMDTARLDVDARNPTGALELYAALGYRRRGSFVMYSIEL